MSEVSNDPWGLHKAPRWQQLTLLIILTLGGISLCFQGYEWYMGSPDARAIKRQMEPLAEQLVKAQKLGDKQTVLALAEPTVKIVNDYNSLDDARKQQINQLPLRNCVLAAVHLSSGPVEVLQAGYWFSKDKYDAAISECK